MTDDCVSVCVRALGAFCMLGINRFGMQIYYLAQNTGVNAHKGADACPWEQVRALVNCPPYFQIMF